MTYYGIPEAFAWSREWADEVKADELAEGTRIIHDHAIWTVDQVREARSGNPDLREVLIIPATGKRRGGDIRAVMVPREHHPVCASCGGLWPCREHRMHIEGQRIMLALRYQCGSCGKSVRGMSSQFTTPEGISRIYHWAKKYGRCRQAAMAEAQRCGLRLLSDGRATPDA